MRVKPLRSASAHAFGSYDSGSTSRWNRRRPFAGDVSTALPASSSPSSYEHVPSSARAALRVRGCGAAQVVPKYGRQGGELIELRGAVVVTRVGVAFDAFDVFDVAFDVAFDVFAAAAVVGLVAAVRRESDARQLRHERALQLVLPRRVHASRNRAHRVFFSFDARPGRARSITPPSSASTSATRHAPAYAGIRMA